GFPTANLVIEENYKLVPAYGIYAVEGSIISPSLIEVGEFEDQKDLQTFKGMGYIGSRPTINGVKRSIEVNLLDFDGDLYGQILRVKFIHFIRHDERFDSLEEMTKQIAEDEKEIRKLLG